MNNLDEYVKEKRKKRRELRYEIVCPICGGNIFNVFRHHGSITGSVFKDIPEYVCINCGEDDT